MANRDENPFETKTDERPKTRVPRKRRRMWPWFLLLLLVGVFFLPTIIGKTSLKDRAIKYATADFNGTVNVNDISLGWFSPIRLEGISVLDAQSEPMLQVAEVTTTKPLLGFITGSDYGELNIEQPVMYLNLRPDGSNLEESLAKYMASPSDENELMQTQPAQPIKLPKMTIKCNNGRAIVTSAATNEQWNVDGLNVVANTNTDDAPLTVEAQCQFVDNDGNPVGGFATNCQVDSGADALTFGAANVAINSQNVPLALAAPIAQRFVGPTQTAGYMTGEMQLGYSAPGTQITINIPQMEILGAGISAPELIGPDSVYAESLTANGQLNISPQQISATKFMVKSEFAALNADGVFDPNQLNNLVAEGQLLNTPFHMEGAVDVARVATMLPNTLQLHDDLTIQSGVISFQASSRQHDNGGDSQNRIVVNVDTANIRAKRGNQDIVWQKPLRLAGVVNQVDGQFALEDVIVESDFLTMQGAGSLQMGDFEANGDLSKLVERVGQFADLGGLELAGGLNGRFGWRLSAAQGNGNSISLQNRPIEIAGRFDITNPSIKWPELPLWQPEQLSIKLVSNGQSVDENTISLSSGTVDVLIGSEKLKATIAEPVANIWSQQAWKFNCGMTGRLAGWLGHAKNFVDLGTIAGDGDVNLTCVANVNSSVMQLYGIVANVDQFAFDGYGMTIREPRLESKANLNYNFANGNIAFSKISTAGKSIVANCEQLLVSFEPNMQVDGDVNFQGDVNRIADWYGLSPTPTDIRWYGTLEGVAKLASNSDGIGGRVVSSVTNLVAAQPVDVSQDSGSPMQMVSSKTEWMEIWKEAKVDIDSTLRMSNDFDSLQFENLNVDSSSLTMATQGSISQLASSFLMDLNGTWNPNWQMINSLLDAYTGKMVRFSGSGEQPFNVRGPLFAPSNGQSKGWIPPQLQVNTNVAWDAADIFKFVLGPNKLTMNVNQGVAQVGASSISVAGGTVNLASQVDMRGENPLLYVDQGVVAQDIQLTAETCRQWLKYVAPMFADATSAQGTFTVSSKGIQVPLFDPVNANAQGALQLTNVTIGAGPLAEQLIGSINQLKSIIKPGSSSLTGDNSTWLKMDEQEVPFAVQNQRIFHDGVKFSHDEVTVRTRGSVGLDQTLDMVAEIPLADEWLDGNRWLQSLKGQTISIPIGGTVTKPRLDKRAMQQLTQQIARSAASSALNKAVEDKLGGAPQRVINDRLNEEVGKVQNKLNNKLQEEIGDKLGNELMNGLNGLFKKGGGQ